MTIKEAITLVLQDSKEGLSAKEIYNQIIKRNLYVFNAQNPVQIVNVALRRHCQGLDFPTAHPIKFFALAEKQGNTNTFIIHKAENSKQKILLDVPKSSELLPEEKIELALNEHLVQLKQLLLENILKQPPAFFEHLVVKLLLKMGYGYDKNSGTVTGGPHDGGIDGIISQDSLGLDLIYIQAKRYSNNKIERKELQAFIGAMGHIQKGVFITTSDFSSSAYEFNKSQQQKNIKLINGELLVDHMVKHEVGIQNVMKFNIYKLDTDFFN